MSNTETDISINRKVRVGIYFLSIAHFLIAIFYGIQLFLIIRNNLMIEDQTLKKLIVDSMTYISISMSVVLIILNLITGIGLIKFKTWSWWISASFFLGIAFNNFIACIYNLYIKIFILGFDDHIFISDFDFVLKNLYLSIIATIALLFLYDNQIYYQYIRSKTAKKKNFFISIGICLVIIILRMLLESASQMLSD